MIRNILLTIAVVALAGCGGGGGSTVTQLTCFNNGDGNQTCIDGSGNVTDSKCVTINGSLATDTGGPCDASSPTTTTTTTGG